MFLIEIYSKSKKILISGIIKYKKNIPGNQLFIIIIFLKLSEPEKQVETDEVKSSINKFVNGELERQSFEKCLRNNNINPKNVDIDKVIRSGKLTHKQLTLAINKSKTS